ncbi:FAS-associated death domain protein-like [Hemicordylus capensis]|uniref:FAS-associated death domain protein-like n=1 Tax=Hemicordylus capensis TaxID=884348 RepID=UPI0023022199|nr:FAS-associated death domain protein-like [Hemicordylus capensis]
MAVAELLLAILNDLADDELRTFAYHLSFIQPSGIPRGRLSGATRVQLAELLMQHYPAKELEVTAEVLRKIPRNDLLRRCHLPLGEMARAGEEPPPRMEVPMQAAAAGQNAGSMRVPESKLMTLAGNMGKKWKQIGIEFLGVTTTRLEQIEEENSTEAMRAFYMLMEWKNNARERATPAHLFGILSQERVPLDHDAYKFLVENA